MGEKHSIEENIFIILEIVLIEEEAHIYPDVLCSIGRLSVFCVAEKPVILSLHFGC